MTARTEGQVERETSDVGRERDVGRGASDVRRQGLRADVRRPTSHVLRLGGAAPLIASQILLAVAILGFWEFASGRLIDSFFVSKPSLVAVDLWKAVESGSLFRDIWVTVARETVVGFAAGAPLAILLGFLLAQAPRAAAVLRPFILALYGIPRIALAPLFIVWFGIGEISKVFLAMLITFFLVFFNTYSGISSVDPGLKNVARVMGTNRLQMLTKVILPAASPWIIDGLRIAFPQALVAAVVAEVVMSTVGIGHRIILSTQTFNMTGTMTGVITLVVVVMLVSFLLDKIESVVLRWRPAEAKSTASAGT
jgi:NitT/TauT family transport system permease protein